MVIKYNISAYENLAEPMVARIYEAQAPEAVVWEEEIPLPHTTPKTIVANGLDMVVHIVRLYTKTTNQKLHEYNVEPTVDTATIFDPIHFKIGDGGTNTPMAETGSYINELLRGLGDNDYTVFRNNYGYLHPNLHYTNQPLSGGFDLVNPDWFNPDEEFTIQMKPKVNTMVVNDSVVGKWFGGFVDIQANTSYKFEHLRKLIRFSGSPVYTFEATDAIPIGYTFCFNHYGAAGTAKVRFLNAPLKFGILGTSEYNISFQSEAAFVFDGAAWNIVYMTQATPQGSEILARGQYYLGDVMGRDQVITIAHNQNIQGGYNVFFSFRSNRHDLHYRDNTIGAAWHYDPFDQPNKFRISLQEISSEVQDIYICWMIIKYL